MTWPSHRVYWQDPTPLDDVHVEAVHDWLDERPPADDDRPSRREAEADAREDARHAPPAEPVRRDGWTIRADRVSDHDSR